MTSCAGCGFVYEDLSLEAVPGALRGFARSYREAFGALDPEVVSERPEPAVWSALEYACHLRDVFLIQRDRLVLAQVVERPHPVPMSRDERVTICRYDAQLIDKVLDQLAMASELCALVFEGLTTDGWSRELVFNWPTSEDRDLGWVGRHTVHEGDIDRVLAAVGVSGGVIGGS